ncbi:hypothetical protein CZ787_03080 [Halomonas citrativorans]|uniref:Lipoprotein n=1 Tax=Halomonas citrativorans TaxID=2742612 RepID=A0A1R4HRK8_9GAMM|nr:hypothetical protein [Halomonas citrativorans]SJN10189.1 hypothetical protein CZ787_03080 [Halomonas citrativorans]
MTVRTIVIVAAGALLAACGSKPPELPPPPAINVYQCATPTGMTERERQPLPPMGDYSQADVALFITDLHQWGARGWLRVARIREHADKCAQSAEDDDND